MTLSCTRPSPDTPSRLDQVLHRVRMRGDFYCQAELTDPWALQMPAVPDTVSFHVVTEGSCALHLDRHRPLDLHAGDCVLVPHGRGHLLTSPAADGHGPPLGLQAFRVDRLPQHYLSPTHSRLEHGGGGDLSRLICGIVGFDEPAARHLSDHLPALLVLTRDQLTAHTRILESVRLMGEELATQSVGGDVVASRLADIIVIQAIRAWLSHHRARNEVGWIAAMEDERIGPVLVAVHADPGQPWTVASMARVAMMSRSTFSARFAELMGETPMAYVTRWRMDLARTELSDGRKSTAQVAAAAGYSSEAAFVRAFTRTVGSTPGAWRRAHSRSADTTPTAPGDDGGPVTAERRAGDGGTEGDAYERSGRSRT